MDTTADIYFMIVGATILLVLLLATIISLIFIYQNRQIRSQLDLKNVRVEYEQELLKTQLEIREQTLKNISEEIHDNVGQILSLANVGLTSIDLAPTDPLKAKIDNAMQLISQSIGDLRDLSKTLDPDNITKTSLKESLQFEIRLLQKTGMFQTVCNLTGNEWPLDPARQLLLFRIVQESINNIIKHAHADRVEVNLTYTDHAMRLTIEDNGIGINPITGSQQSKPDSGAGLRNMKNRAKLIKAELNVLNRPTGGTSVVIELNKGALNN